MRICWLVVVAVLLALPVSSQNFVFYDDLETGDTSAWWAPARVGETGQVTCWNEVGTMIACAGTGQDGDVRGGVAWPHPRFVANGDGTVTDTLSGLVWLRNASCFGQKTWAQSLNDANALASGACGLTDGSAAGDWRLPSVKELQSLIDFEYYARAISNAAGTGQWTEGDAFSAVQSSNYWSSTSYVSSEGGAWYVSLNHGYCDAEYKTAALYVWPVRGVE